MQKMGTEREPQLNGARSSRSVSSPRLRTRRSSEEVEKLILESAQRLFSEKGFWGTTTREIADTAGVAEVLLFRHFGSKAELYSTSVVLPMIEFISHWLADDWSQWDRRQVEDKQYEFNSRFYQIVADNRGLIMSYLAMSVFEADLISGLEHTARLRQTVDQLADRCSGLMSRMGIGAGVNVRVSTRAALSMVLAMALLYDLSDPPTPFPRADVITEMTQLMLYGSLNRPSGITWSNEQRSEKATRQRPRDEETGPGGKRAG